ncbi:hypothetical protein PHYBOEH_011730 [Phytophthora boehmeriae]|uniref:Uncharacterized protein n=1 Tax=Phytophthora boehmeriae TaxID=109152 RepID=A0A8T1WXD6_9STRA|nr:hypothetical protein PHYBOEH_011730 [Phytophthora boehmeriae]
MANQLRRGINCLGCAELSQELTQLRQSSQEQAEQDHAQCMAMLQKMQQLVQLNESLIRNSSHSGGGDFESSGGGDTEQTVKKREETGHRDTQIRRLQNIIVQQAKEIELLRRKQQDALADGRVRRATTSVLPIATNQEVARDRGTRDQAEDGRSDTTDIDEEEEDGAKTVDPSRPAVKRHMSYLCKLPLTSLHAKLKSKDLQVRHLQQVVAKMETRFGQLIDRKRSMEQSYQQTAKTQQAHLKKYLAYIQQQAGEKKALERRVHELNQYVSVLEKKIVSSTTLRDTSR